MSVEHFCKKENSNVCIFQLFFEEMPKTEVMGFDRKKKEHIKKAGSVVVKVYNTHIGNVDLLDKNIGRHHIKVRSKGWCLRLVFNLIDTIAVNSWILFRTTLDEIGVTDTPISQNKFRTDLTTTLCQAVPEQKKRCRPRISDAIESKIFRDRDSSLL